MVLDRIKEIWTAAKQRGYDVGYSGVGYRSMTNTPLREAMEFAANRGLTTRNEVDRLMRQFHRLDWKVQMHFQGDNGMYRRL